MKTKRQHSTTAVRLLLVATIGITILPRPARGDWPMYLHDAGRSGYTEEGLSEKVFKLVTDNSWTLRELYTETATLDDVFARLTKGAA